MKTPNSQTKSFLWTRGTRSSGQALIEYILVVCITVIIIATLVQRMYRPMDNFVRNIMGTYVGCLLETGELPKLGADSADQADSECKIDLFADGAPTGEQAENDKDKDDDKSDDEDEESSKAGGSRAGYAGRGGVRRTFALGGGRRRGTMGAEKFVLKGEEGGGSRLSGGGNDYFGSSSRGFANQRRSRYVAITGAMAEEVAKKNKNREKTKITVPKEVSIGGQGGTKKLALQPPEHQDRQLASDDIASLDISQIIKFILIAGIILILVILIGGQMLSLSKSWEKGE